MTRWLLLPCAVSMLILAVVRGHGESGTDGSTAIFRDITTQAGIRFVHERATLDPRLTKIMTWVTSINAGACAADYDNDGDVDFYLLTSKPGALNALQRNEGRDVFVDVAAEAGVAAVNGGDGLSMACLFADVDNDGDQDLFVASYGRNRLFQNDGAGHFAEIGLAAGMRETGNSSSALFFDYDGDGYLDLLVGRYFPYDMRQLTTTAVLQTSFDSARNGAPNLLYHNNHDGTFTEVGHRLGVDDTGWTLALGAGDLDDDGDLDVYVANDYGPDKLYRNNGDGTFTDVTRDAIGVDGDAGMNVDMGDFDGDGRLDIYVTNITNRTFDQGNMLWKNLGGLRFVNVAGVTNARDGGWGWGAKFFDFDNDGDLDIYTVNGFVSDGPIDIFRMGGEIHHGDVSDIRAWPDMRGLSLSGYERKRLFRNDGDQFTEVAAQAGLDSLADGRGIALADIDGDGDLDVLATNVAAAPILYRNDVGQRRAWLEAELIGATGNRDAIGARITVSAGGMQQIREVDSGNGFSAQSSRLVHVGLRDAGLVERMDIRWPNGRRVRHRDLPVRSRLVIREEGGTAR